MNMTSPVVEVIESLSAEELDALPFGVIYLDRVGMVLRYNRTESELSGCPPERVLGRIFFTDVAPCTKVREFYGVFADKVNSGTLDEHFTFTFPFANAPRTMNIHMVSGPNQTAWVFLLDHRHSNAAAELDKLQSC
jgi:two-component system, chemotaxis family, sensor kinase Cph1